MFSFDFYESTGSGTDPLFIGYTDDRLGSTRARAQFSLSDGNLGVTNAGDVATYSLDTVYTAFLVLNDTATAQNYNGVSIAAETASLWIQESGSSLAYAGSIDPGKAANTDGYALAFTSFNAATPEVWVDNVELSVVPEPSTMALLLGSLGLLALRRRRA